MENTEYMRKVVSQTVAGELLPLGMQLRSKTESMDSRLTSIEEKLNRALDAVNRSQTRETNSSCKEIDGSKGVYTTVSMDIDLYTTFSMDMGQNHI